MDTPMESKGNAWNSIYGVEPIYYLLNICHLHGSSGGPLLILRMVWKAIGLIFNRLSALDFFFGLFDDPLGSGWL